MNFVPNAIFFTIFVLSHLYCALFTYVMISSYRVQRIVVEFYFVAVVAIGTGFTLCRQIQFANKRVNANMPTELVAKILLQNKAIAMVDRSIKHWNSSRVHIHSESRHIHSKIFIPFPCAMKIEIVNLKYFMAYSRNITKQTNLPNVKLVQFRHKFIGIFSILSIWQ